MKKTDTVKYISILVSVISFILYFSGFHTIGMILPVPAMILLMFSPHKSGTIFTFTLFLNVFAISITVDYPFNKFPATFIFLTGIAIVFNIRTWFYNQMTIIRMLWMESFLSLLFSLSFIVAAYLTDYTWLQWLCGSPPIILFGMFSLIVYMDRNEARNLVSKLEIKKGSIAPDFTLPDQNGNPVTLKHLLSDSHVLLIFVRGDWCPTCHMMLRGYVRNKEKFAEKNVRIIGIGPDPEGVNKDIMSRLDPNSFLLSDTDQTVTTQYVMELQANNPVTKSLYKKGIPLPASFLINKNGQMIFSSRSDKAGEILQPDKIFEVLQSLN